MESSMSSYECRGPVLNVPSSSRKVDFNSWAAVAQGSVATSAMVCITILAFGFPLEDICSMC